MWPLTEPSALTVNIMKNTECSIIVVQWDEVDDFFATTYIVTWTSEKDNILHHAALTEQSSYTIIGITLDTVYTINVKAANKCGEGPEYSTSVSLTITAVPTMSPTVTTGIIPIMFTSSVNYGTTTAIINLTPATTTTAMINLDTTSTATAATTTATNIVIISYVTLTSTACANPANTTTAVKTCKF